MCAEVGAREEQGQPLFEANGSPKMIKLAMDTYGHLFPQTDTSEAFAAAERALLSA